MRVAIVGDAFPPMRTSAAVQLRDLAIEFKNQGHEVTVIVPAADLPDAWTIDTYEGVTLLRLRAPKTKDIGYARRTLAEFAMPFTMLRNYKKSPLASSKWHGVVWYSPSIFFGPFVNCLKKRSNCPSYLILRDIFPEWAVDMGVMGRGLPYRCFKMVESYQYSVADMIGVQTPANIAYFSNRKQHKAHIEVLQNWLAPAPARGCSIEVEKTALQDRFVFVYAGNMGRAQGLDIVVDLANKLRARSDIGFLLVGRGSETERLRASVDALRLDNVLFFDEIDPVEIAGLYKQCRAGLISLDHRHRTHNIPGKFLSYVHAGLPVLASVNKGNDLVKLINENRVGFAASGNDADELAKLAVRLVDEHKNDVSMSERCLDLAGRLFSSKAAVERLCKSLGRQRAAEREDEAALAEARALPDSKRLQEEV
jgi:glycosyltransferase involved in cell wall biosynthesis